MTTYNLLSIHVGGRYIYYLLVIYSVAVLARPKGGTIQSQRAEYFPILPTQGSEIIDLATRQQIWSFMILTWIT